MTKYGRSPWTDEFPKSRIPSYPRHRGPLEIDVAIVGGGLTGCATAYAFAAAGLRVALFEANRIGQASTGAAAGWVSDDPGVSFLELEKALGRRAARHAWQSWRRASLDFAALIRRLELRCYLESRQTLVAATGVDQASRLKREHKARRDAGLDVSLINARQVSEEAGLVAGAALRSRDGATLDPYRAALGLAASAAARGAAIFEQTPVARIRFGRRTADVLTAGGALRVRRVIVTTGSPTPLFKSLMRHFWFMSSYLVLTEPIPAKARQMMGRRHAVVRDQATPAHVIRWVDERLLVTGADAEAEPPRQADKVIVQRTGQLMYELSTLYPEMSGIAPAYGWQALYARTADGLPYIGPHRNYPHHLFAFGDGSHSVTGAFLASRLLLRHHLGEVDPADEAFGFNR